LSVASDIRPVDLQTHGVTREPREPKKEADHEVRPDRPRRGKPDASEQGRHSKRAEDETDTPPIRP